MRHRALSLSSDEEDDSHAREPFPEVAAVPAASPLRRWMAALVGVIFRPVRELFFLVSWVVWLFSSITLSTIVGTGKRRAVAPRAHGPAALKGTHLTLVCLYFLLGQISIVLYSAVRITISL